MAADGEETTKVVDVVVEGAYDDAVAHGLGLAITDSDLVRSSFYGADPNWGRVLAALGASGYPMDQSTVSVSYEGVAVAEGGAEVAYDRPALISRLQGDFTLTVEVGDGPGSARIIAADLTPGYVEFNGEPS
jgi:N-acetylglutamate synthase/N-acetylornithine aminotransferase